jgi:hypothetical protein
VIWFIKIDEAKKYPLALSISLWLRQQRLCPCAFLSKAISESAKSKGAGDTRREYIDIPLSIPPLTMSAEKAVAASTSPLISK